MNNDDELRRKTAEEWGRMYHAELKPEQINCRGCLSEERFSHCDYCGIRSCSIEKQQSNCGTCDSFPCNKVKDVIDHDEDARGRLEAFKK
jgi:hypothetical protein